MSNLFDFARVLGALLLLYFALPVAARRISDTPPQPWWSDIVPAFVRASLFFEITCVILGNWRICFSGLVVFLTICWFAASVVFASERRWIWETETWRSRILSVLRFIETGEWRLRASALAQGITIQWSQAGTLIALLVGVSLFELVSFPISNYRFLSAQSYNRALSLQTLIRGGVWTVDGSVAILAPIAHFSGADGAAVVRFISPLVVLLLAAAGGYCAWVYSRRFSAAYFACGLLIFYPLWTGPPSARETAGPELACLFWVLAVAMIRHSWTYAFSAGTVAVLVYPEFTPQIIESLVLILIALVISGLARLVPRALTLPARLATAAVFTVMIIGPLKGSATAEGPFEYEAAARIANHIARQYPRNQWLLVSPAHELPVTYGRGWHLELSEFVREYSPNEVSPHEFRFPYSAPELFVMVEKEPLPQNVRNSAFAADQYSYQYLTQIGRTALEFNAARLVSAYALSHQNLSVFYEDEQIAVYRIHNSN